MHIAATVSNFEQAARAGQRASCRRAADGHVKEPGPERGHPPHSVSTYRHVAMPPCRRSSLTRHIAFWPPGRYDDAMLRPESWSRLTGESPVRVGTGAPGSRPRFVVETRRAERGVKSLFGGSKCAGRSAIRCESCSLVTGTTKEPSRSCHGEGHARRALVRGQLVGSFRGTGSGTCTQSGSEQERPVWHAYVRQETKGISRW